MTTHLPCGFETKNERKAMDLACRVGREGHSKAGNDMSMSPGILWAEEKKGERSHKEKGTEHRPCRGGTVGADWFSGTGRPEGDGFRKDVLSCFLVLENTSASQPGQSGSHDPGCFQKL